MSDTSRLGPSLTILLHTFYATGHVLPTQAVAQSLISRGHTVYWLTSRTQSHRVLASGAHFLPTRAVHAADLALQSADPKDLPGCADALFGRRLLAQVEDIRDAIKVMGRKPDVLVNDALPQGAAAVWELGELGEKGVFATLGVVPMYLPREKDKVRSALGMLITDHANTLPVINPQREQLGLKALGTGDVVQYSPKLHIQASCPRLEYADGTDKGGDEGQAEEVFYVGPLVSKGKKKAELPEWWGDVLAAPGRGQRVVFITQGTFAVDPKDLVIPAVGALREDTSLLLVVASTQEDVIRTHLDGHDLGNVRIGSWVPYSELLPLCDVLVTNGGYGSVTQALSAGVPLVCAGTSEDKKDTAARMVHCGAGISLGTDRPEKEKVSEAVQKVLKDGSYKEKAKAVGSELNALGGAEKVADILEGAVAKSTGR